MEKRITPQERYDSKNCIYKGVKLNINTDKDIIDKLKDIENFQGYVKELIRKDIEK